MTTKNINSLTQTYFLIGVNIKTLTKYLFHALITVSQNVVSVIRISLFVTETLFFCRTVICIFYATINVTVAYSHPSKIMRLSI